MPWRGYRGERLLLVLIAVAALGLHPANSQDDSRFGLTQALYEDGSVRIDRFVTPFTVDKARFDGHYYSDKAPGLSVLALAPFAALDGVGQVGQEERAAGVWSNGALSWTLRLLTSGVLFVLAVAAVGRVAEGLGEGIGAAAAASFGLGTLAFQLAATSFGHVAAGALGFASFLLAWAAVDRSRNGLLVLSGLCAGLAVAVEYQLAVVGILVFVYAVWRSRQPRAAIAFVAGTLPAAAGLGVYHWIAFGSPFRTAYRYIDNGYTEEQQQGFFGVGAPDLENIYRILFTRHGLLTATPILVLAAAGLLLLWRRGRKPEAVVCGAVALSFFLLNAGYFDPYGGSSPGPRFFAPALPLLAVGVAASFARLPRLTAAAAAFSVIAMAVDATTASFTPQNLGGVELTETIWSIAGAPASIGIAAGVVATVGAVVLAARNLFLLAIPRQQARLAPLPPLPR